MLDPVLFLFQELIWCLLVLELSLAWKQLRLQDINHDRSLSCWLTRWQHRSRQRITCDVLVEVVEFLGIGLILVSLVVASTVGPRCISRHWPISIPAVEVRVSLFIHRRARLVAVLLFVNVEGLLAVAVHHLLLVKARLTLFLLRRIIVLFMKFSDCFDFLQAATSRRSSVWRKWICAIDLSCSSIEGWLVGWVFKRALLMRYRCIILLLTLRALMLSHGLGVVEWLVMTHNQRASFSRDASSCKVEVVRHIMGLSCLP